MSRPESDSTTENKWWSAYAVIIAVVAWLALWGITHLPVNNLTKVLFFVALFFAVASTLMPAIAYLNARFGRASSPRIYRLRFIRQSGQIGLFVVAVAWLQMLRVLNLMIVLVLIGVFVLIETFLIAQDMPANKS